MKIKTAGKTGRNSKMPSQRTQRPGSKLRAPIYERLADLATIEPALSAVAIHAQVNDDFGHSTVSLSTVEDVVAFERSLGGGRAWSLATDRTGQPRAILEMMRSLREVSEGRRTHVTVREAALIARISVAAPSLVPFDRWRLARAYLTRLGRGATTDDLDMLLALEPFRDQEHHDQYAREIEAGRIPALPAHLASLAIPFSPVSTLFEVLDEQRPADAVSTPRRSGRAKEGSSE